MSGCDYKLKTPCANCPFRTDVPGYLTRDRAREIQRALNGGGEFPCHKTTVPDPDDDGQNTVGPKSQFCAGALGVMLKDPAGLNQITRIAERLGLWDPDRIDPDAPVFDSLNAFAAHHDTRGDYVVEEDDERDYCSVADQDCEAPAGYLEGDAVVAGDEMIDTTCDECGAFVCESCAMVVGERFMCPSCGEVDDAA